MDKKLISGIIALVIMLTSASAMAGRDVPSVVKEGGYLPGESEYVVNADDVIGCVVEADGSVKISAGGSATWGFYLPYNSRSVTIVYTGGASISITTDEFTYPKAEVLTNGENQEYKIVFGENSGRADSPQYRTWGTSSGILLEHVEHSGEKEITISSDSEINIYELRFEKELTMGPPYIAEQVDSWTQIHETAAKPNFAYNKNTPNVYDDNIQRYETEISTSVLIHESSNVITVDGANRYIDNNSVWTTPYNFNGVMYLPVSTLAKALGYYYEEIPEKGYALMRSDSHEISLIGGQCHITEGQGDVKAEAEDVFIYKDGQILAGVRYFAELLGETVEYKDGLVVIDDKYTVRDILGDEDFYEYVCAKVSPFAQQKKSEAERKVYYVAPEGEGKSDNSGTYDSPLTLSSVQDCLTPGDTVILKEGIYRETLTPTVDGAAGEPITYKAEKGKEVLISANDLLGEPKGCDDATGVYKYDMSRINLGDGRNQIFIDGALQTEARFPDGPGFITEEGKELSNAWGIRGEIFKLGESWSRGEYTGSSTDTMEEVAVYDTDTVVSNLLLGYEDDAWVGGTYVGTFGCSYAVLSGKIIDSKSGSVTIGSDRNKRWWDLWSQKVYTDGNNMWNYGMIVGHKNAMNLEGEWVRNNDGTLEIILPQGADATAVEAKARQRVIDLRGRSYINIEGIDTIGGGITMQNSTMCVLNDMDMKYISHYTLASDSKNGYIGFPFENKDEGEPEAGELGIYLGGRDNALVNSHIDHSAGAGIYAAGVYSYIDNNIINDCGYMGSYVAGIHIDTVPYEHKNALRGGHSIYNNTVYNTGRGSIDFGRNEDFYYGYSPYPESVWSHSYAPYLPCDIAYNDLHDAMLTTQDGGVIYSNGTYGGIDKNFTDIRNNYIYKTVSANDINPYEMLLYFDSNVSGYDNSNNLLFVTGDRGNTRMTNEQDPTYDREAYNRAWNNQVLGKIELDEEKPVADALADEYFSEDRPFYAGSYQGRGKGNRYLNNYNRINSEKYTMEYRAAEAEPSDAEKIDMGISDGYIALTESGQYIEFSDVDFGENSNEMVISYRCDSNWTFDEFEMTIYDTDIAEGEKYEFTLPQQEPREAQTCTHRFAINSTSGKKTVRLKVIDYYSARIGGISVYKRELSDEMANMCTYFTYMSEYTDGRPHNSNTVTEKLTDSAKTTTSVTGANPYAYAIYNTLENTILRYANAKISADSDYFVMAAGSEGVRRKQPVYVYALPHTEAFVNPTKAPNISEPIAKFVVYNQADEDMTPIKVPITNDEGYLKEGTYDIYLEFRKETTSTEESSTILYFGFLGKDTDTSDISSQVCYQGGLFDSDISSQETGNAVEITNADGTTKTIYRVDNPLMSVNLSSTSHARKMLINTFSERVAGYGDVDVLSLCDRLTVCYYVSDEKYSGQPVRVRITDADGNSVAYADFTTRACEAGVFREETIILYADEECTEAKNLDSGSYKVYFEFGGEEGSNKTCQLGWFRFEEKE